MRNETRRAGMFCGCGAGAGSLMLLIIGLIVSASVLVAVTRPIVPTPLPTTYNPALSQLDVLEVVHGQPGVPLTYEFRVWRPKDATVNNTMTDAAGAGLVYSVRRGGIVPDTSDPNIPEAAYCTFFFDWTPPTEGMWHLEFRHALEGEDSDGRLVLFDIARPLLKPIMLPKAGTPVSWFPMIERYIADANIPAVGSGPGRGQGGRMWNWQRSRKIADEEQTEAGIMRTLSSDYLSGREYDGPLTIPKGYGTVNP